MKLKKIKGQVINGYLVKDSYHIELPSGCKTRRVLLVCQKCGREFERNAGVDFDHIKCKCMCKPSPQKREFRFVYYKGIQYTMTEFCKMNNISVGTFSSRIKNGMSIEDSIKKEFINTCVICEKTFVDKRPGKKYCSKTCKNRANCGKGKYKKINPRKCVVCGKEYLPGRVGGITCSDTCRGDLARIERNKRYKKLRAIGRFDQSVTLKAVYKKYNGKCQMCGKETVFLDDWKSNDYPSIDHIIPLSKGGVHEWENVQLLCRECNCKKGAS